ncbi:MAG TPA: hypothetical protein PKE45_22630 [Caldilineaceae bacterium]|nr:hypothetical protein [Caldilineaceae bacterium]
MRRRQPGQWQGKVQDRVGRTRQLVASGALNADQVQSLLDQAPTVRQTPGGVWLPDYGNPQQSCRMA